MIFLIVGHRGVGKSWSLSTLKRRASDAGLDIQCFDLDAEIEKRYGSIDEIFKSQGEAHFRKMEEEVFNTLRDLQGSLKVIALGGGFDLSQVEADEVLWLKRRSDSSGRIFLDRPRLEQNRTPLQEWQVRYEEREKRFRIHHTQVLTLPEGPWLAELVLSHFFSFWFPELKSISQQIPYDVTLLVEDLERVGKKEIFKNARRIEIRDDIEKTDKHLQSIEVDQLYFSTRTQKKSSVEWTETNHQLRSDWDLSLGRPPHLHYWSYSLHSSEVKRFKEYNLPQESVLKWAPEIYSFAELKQGHNWYLEDPSHRAFLPRSLSGRWHWYRHLFGPQMPIHFVRDDQGSSMDQPFWYEAWLQPLESKGFAAVLGDPVHLSWSPSFHYEFFKAHSMPFVAIDLPKEEFVDGLEFLRELGLRAAAVTSPLKKEAFRVLDEMESSDAEMNAVNTLILEDHKIRGFNTDVIGLKKLSHRLNSNPTVIWGGGGLEPSLRVAFPEAEFFKARQGGAIPKDSTLIWASIRSPEVKIPTPLAHLREVIDLNYSENSMGRELALQSGCRYVSGELFFIEQAQAQQEFWRRFL